MAGQAICRQTPKVGAECVNGACSDLCGGRSVMGVPTAIIRRLRIQANLAVTANAGWRSSTGQSLNPRNPGVEIRVDSVKVKCYAGSLKAPLLRICMKPVFELNLNLPDRGSRRLLHELHTQLKAANLDSRLKPGLRLPERVQEVAACLS